MSLCFVQRKWGRGAFSLRENIFLYSTGKGGGHSCIIFLAASFPERYTGIIGEGVFFFSLCVIAFLCMVQCTRMGESRLFSSLGMMTDLFSLAVLK